MNPEVFDADLGGSASELIHVVLYGRGYRPEPEDTSTPAPEFRARIPRGLVLAGLAALVAGYALGPTGRTTTRIAPPQIEFADDALRQFVEQNGRRRARQPFWVWPTGRRRPRRGDGRRWRTSSRRRRVSVPKLKQRTKRALSGAAHAARRRPPRWRGFRVQRRGSVPVVEPRALLSPCLRVAPIWARTPLKSDRGRARLCRRRHDIFIAAR